MDELVSAPGRVQQDLIQTDLPSLEEAALLVQSWVQQTVEQLASVETGYQVLVFVSATIIGLLLSPYPTKRLKALADKRTPGDGLARLFNSFLELISPIFVAGLMWAGVVLFDALGQPNQILRIGASLLNAWIIIRLVTSNMKPGFWTRALSIAAWTVAALYILRWLEPVTRSLDAAQINIAGISFSVYQLITSLIVAVLALWLGRIAGDAAQSSLKSSRSLTPSLAGLLGQVAKITLMLAAVFFALSAIGVNLTALTVFTGALGVGIGFGMQAIFSNFISGVIILFEKSVKVGDFIELQSGVTGLVREINIRATLVTTNDNVDILVPNEEFIKAQVINWTLKETRRRMHVPFGVAYGSNKELVRQAGLEAAAEVPWTYTSSEARKPQVWLVGFGDSALDFELVVWLTDEAVMRPARVKADYNWALHTALEKYEIEIPFPQRDVNFPTDRALPVKISKD